MAATWMSFKIPANTTVDGSGVDATSAIRVLAGAPGAVRLPTYCVGGRRLPRVGESVRLHCNNQKEGLFALGVKFWS